MYPSEFPNTTTQGPTVMAANYRDQSLL